jgi:hypothetical protein
MTTHNQSIQWQWENNIKDRIFHRKRGTALYRAEKMDINYDYQQAYNFIVITYMMRSLNTGATVRISEDQLQYEWVEEGEPNDSQKV